MRRMMPLLFCLYAGSAWSAADFSDQRMTQFEAYLDGLMAAQQNDYKLAGMTFAMVHDGRLVFSKGYGYADLDTQTAVDPAIHLFRPGSVSKLFTWTAVMQLVEQGKLDLQADISRYVDQLTVPNDFNTPMTLEHLLTHTPGLEDGAAGYLFGDEESDLEPLADVLARYAPTQVRQPGTYSSYSNWATALAGLIVANVSGMSFEDYVAKHLFAPLNMRHATFEEPLPEALAADMSTGYIEEAGALVPLGFEYIKNFGPAGALSASANDMANFMLAHLNHGAYGESRILQPQTVALMHSNLFGHHPSLAHWAHGFYEFHRNDQRFIGHGGDTIAFHSQLVLDPGNDFGFFLSFNASDGARARAAVVNGIVDYFYPPTVLPYHAEPLPGSAERVEQVAGAYRITRRSYTKLEGMIGLTGDLMVRPAEDAAILIPQGNSIARFEEIEPFVFRQVGSQARVAFGTDDDGEVTHAFIGILSADKLRLFERAATHQTIIALTLLAALFVCINAVRNRGQLSPGPARTARRMTLGAAISTLLFAAGMAAVLSTMDMNRAVFKFPPDGVGLLLVLPILTGLFTLGAVVHLKPVWGDPQCGVWARIRYSYVTVLFVLQTWVFYYWNMLGWNYY